jgi:hypothetical protein
MARRVRIEDDVSEPSLRGVAPAAAPLALPEGVRPVVARRAASARDVARLAAIEELRRSGTSLVDATWQVLGTDDALGYSRFRDATRPSDVTLRGKYAALLARVCPEVVEQARNVALATFSSSAEAAARRVTKLARGAFTNPVNARVTLDASRTVLEAVGVGPRSGAAVQVNTTVSLGDGLRALRRVAVESVEDADG